MVRIGNTYVLNINFISLCVDERKTMEDKVDLLEASKKKARQVTI